MLEQYHRISQAAGVSIAVNQDGSLQINACEIVVDKNKLDIVKKITGLTNIEALNKHLPPKSFVALNLSGKGIFQKQIEKVAAVNQHNFSRILPNANMDDFYVQHFPSGEYSFVSVIRKTEADKYITELKEQGFVPLQLSLGPFPVENIIAQLNVYDNGLIFNGHIIQRNEQAEWIAVTYDPNSTSPFLLKIESEGINEKLVIPYAAAFQMALAANLHPIQADVPELQQAYTALIDDKKLKVKGALILVVFFILLLINFILFSWLTAANNKLAGQVSQSAQSYTDIQGINDKIKEQQLLLQDLGWDGGINKSALVDQLALLLPEELTWREITINPVDISSSRTQQSLDFYSRQIRVTGLSEKIIPVNEWIARVKAQPWVKTSSWIVILSTVS